MSDGLTTLSDQVELALLIEWKKTAEVHMATTDKAIADLIQERTNALKWGVGTLGAIALALFGFIMALFSDGRISK